MESYINLFELSFFNEFKEKIFVLILKDIQLLNKLDEKPSIIVEVNIYNRNYIKKNFLIILNYLFI